MKMKIFRVLLFISFLPYAFLLIIGIYYAFAGYEVYTLILPTYVKTLYGFEAFRVVLLWSILGLTFIPVLPVCCVYQIIYLISCLFRKQRKKRTL